MAFLGQGLEATIAATLVLACSAACMCDDSGFEKLPPPKPGDWLYVHKERGQTVAQYREQCANRKTKQRSVIYIQPFGDMASTRPELLETLREYLSLFFDCRAVTLDPLPLPKEAFHPKRRWGWDQYDADLLLRKLEDRTPRDAVAVAGITDADLFHGDMNFVFGLAAMTMRVGVYSINRYAHTYRGQPKDCTLLKRTLKVANHEIGHLFFMEHCTRYKCTMNGSNSLIESDSRPIHLCPICLKKLEWNIGFDRVKRYKKLRDFYRKIGLKDDAAFVAKQAERPGP